MTDRPEQIISRYLDEVSNQLSDLSATERNEILADISAHITEAVGDVESASEVAVRNVIDRLGPADEVAREARAREAGAGNSHQPSADGTEVQTIERGTPSALEVAAIILTAIFWPIGILLAWLSPRWLTRDKVIATIIPATASILIGLLMVGGLFAMRTGSSNVVSVVEDVQTAPAPGSPDLEPRSPRQISETGSSESGFGAAIAGLAFLIGVLAAPFITAVYLAVRMQPVVIQIQGPSGQQRGRDGIPASVI